MNKLIKKILIITFLLLSFIMLIKNKDKIVDNLPINYLIVKSNSMFPKFVKNDIIVIWKQNSYNVGDIVCYNYKNEYLITHRIIAINNNIVITKGDNNNCEDSEININDVKGKVILIIKRKTFYIAFFIIISIFIIFCAIKKGL